MTAGLLKITEQQEEENEDENEKKERRVIISVAGAFVESQGLSGRSKLT